MGQRAVCRADGKEKCKVRGATIMTENVCILFLLVDIWLSLGILGVFQKLENRWPWGLLVFTLGIPLLTFIAYTI